MLRNGFFAIVAVTRFFSFQVHAVDEDKGVNGQVKYSIVQQPNQKGTKFTVDEETGEVSTNKVFDREGDDGKFVSVTVKATDQGDPSLEGVCSFTVEITDVNDNPPLFDRQVFLTFARVVRRILPLTRSFVRYRNTWKTSSKTLA